MYLSREQAVAGELCRSCGLPVIDNLGKWPGTMYLTPEQRVEYDADQAKYKEMHSDCEAHRWSMSGSRATHCGYCCPPIPMSREQYESIERIFASSAWREQELNSGSARSPVGMSSSRAFTTQTNSHFSTAWCPDCEMTRGVVAPTKTVEAAARVAEAKRKHDDEVAKAESEVKNAEKAAASARRKKLADLRTST